MAMGIGLETEQITQRELEDIASKAISQIVSRVAACDILKTAELLQSETLPKAIADLRERLVKCGIEQK